MDYLVRFCRLKVKVTAGGRGGVDAVSSKSVFKLIQRQSRFNGLMNMHYLLRLYATSSVDD